MPLLGLAHDIAREGGHGAVTPEARLGIRFAMGTSVAVTKRSAFIAFPLWKPVEEGEIVERLGTLAAQSTERSPSLTLARNQRLLRDAAAVSGELDHRYVGFEHLLLALFARHRRNSSSSARPSRFWVQRREKSTHSLDTHD